jgi:hypothetical protein
MAAGSADGPGPLAWPLHPLRDAGGPSVARPCEQDGVGDKRLSTFAQNMRQQQSRGMKVRGALCVAVRTCPCMRVRL